MLSAEHCEGCGARCGPGWEAEECELCGALICPDCLDAPPEEHDCSEVL